ncbi:VUT family protein [Candidatus Microgenomates bacterium]|nr:MAG: VUT family protein [Candidatus Microgenomates bacterium]
MKILKTDLLVSLYIFCVLVAELMGAKTFPLVNLFGYQLNASVAIFLIPLVFTINDVFVEVYGAERARSVIRSGLLMIVLLLGFITLAVSLPPSSRFANSEAAYDTVFGLSWRITAASLTAFTIADLLDVVIFVRIRKLMGKKALWFRNNASNFLAQFIDTVVFMTLAFYAFNEPLSQNVGFLASLIFPYWLLKCSMSVIETPLVYLGVRWLKKE